MKPYWALLGLLACATPTTAPQLDPETVAKVRRPDTKSVLVLLPASESAEATLAGLKSELAESYDVIPRYIDENTGVNDVEAAVSLVDPEVVVLMNNPTLRLFRAWQAKSGRSLPAVAVLTSFLRETGKGLERLSGVIYEVPLVTSLVNLRTLLTQPIQRVGVLARPQFTSYLEEQRSFLAAEGFELITVAADEPASIKEGLERLRLADKVDAIWVLNDNALLSREALVSGWLPGLRGNTTPVVVNVGSLLSRKVAFGTFAVLPDHRALGVQAATLVETVLTEGWPEGGLQLEYPLSVETVLDVAFARRHLALDEERLATVDRLLE